MIHKVIRMGDPRLRSQNQKFSKEEILSSATQKLVKDMFETMEEYGGIGLAAPQIAINKKLAIIKVPEESSRYPESEESKAYILFNPKITYLDSEQQGFFEGCLSVPGLRGFVERPGQIRVDYLDLQAQKKSLELEGFLATVFQHELDHLDGILYIDRLKDTKLLSYNEEFEEFFTSKDSE